MEPLFAVRVARPSSRRGVAEAHSASAYLRFHDWPVEDQRPLTLLRRLVIEIEDSIAQSRAVILSTRDAIELLERLEGRQFSN
jgi:hypothetical protein